MECLLTNFAVSLKEIMCKLHSIPFFWYSSSLLWSMRDALLMSPVPTKEKVARSIRVGKAIIKIKDVLIHMNNTSFFVTIIFL